MSLFAKDKEKTRPLSVVIIGAGPSGLATAIEAKNSGCQVTIVEKRESYTRTQTHFLLDSSLKLLRKWEIDTSPIKTVDMGDGTSIGIISLNQLEEQLEQRVRALGVEKIYGEFQGLKSPQKALIEICGKGKVALSYDILVAADGAHSKVRDALGIQVNELGHGKGAFVIARYPDDPSLECDISPPISIEDGFLRRIKVPGVSVTFGQFPHSASKEDLQRTLQAHGWSKEAQDIGENKAPFRENVDVYLQQACTFANQKKSSLIVGDAAATASFFQGMGANTALKAAEAAGLFFKEIRVDKKAAFQNFNQSMKEMTDKMIDDSAFLFAQESLSS